jgi:hypothetical protein
MTTPKQLESLTDLHTATAIHLWVEEVLQNIYNNSRDKAFFYGFDEPDKEPFVELFISNTLLREYPNRIPKFEIWADNESGPLSKHFTLRSAILKLFLTDTEIAINKEWFRLLARIDNNEGKESST